MNDIVLQLRSHNLVIAVDVPRRDDLSWASAPQSGAPIRPSALSCRGAHRGEEKNAATTEGSFRVFTATVARVRDCRGRQLRRLLPVPPCRCDDGHRAGGARSPCRIVSRRPTALVSKA